VSRHHSFVVIVRRQLAPRHVPNRRRLARIATVESVEIRPEDARALVELANTVDDCSPQEVEALSRVQKALTEYDRAASLAQEIDHEHLLGAETEERRAEVQQVLDDKGSMLETD
jgi:hypothetical protein